ncbi:hypothetical protein BPAE_0152g00220 [Botrytis paeoniae]|uniref:Uncharacterized protein n=1 Tax=Botrytis paeoniae TaxID=278948 RepID=A0A4Z1FMJ7_9HELO|nr:hypothetical protein BPAE_0152g00220 [Botrytis paeoniae]
MKQSLGNIYSLPSTAQKYSLIPTNFSTGNITSTPPVWMRPRPLPSNGTTIGTQPEATEV